MLLEFQMALQRAAEESLGHRKLLYDNATGGSALNFSSDQQLSLGSMEDGPTNGSLNANETSRACDQWEDTHHVLLQGANLCYAAAFLVPHKFRFSMFVIRTTLTVGFLLVALWAGVHICAPDIFAWNLTLFLTNCAHAMYLSYEHFPPRIDPELYDLYTKVFTPLKVNKKDFKELIREGDIHTLDTDEHYAMEGISVADERLSILLSGKMKATCEDVFLHNVLPFEFIDSPEWESCSAGGDKLFQVTLTAIEHCRFITWRRKNLLTVLKSNHFLDVILYNLIGRDITHKLYSLNEFHRSEAAAKFPQPDSQEWWRHQIPRSLSVDAVHTGTKGHVRSLMWRGQDRRTSSAPSDSVGSSPACTSRYSMHYSDPGPLRCPRRPSPKSAANFQRQRVQQEQEVGDEEAVAASHNEDSSTSWDSPASTPGSYIQPLSSSRFLPPATEQGTVETSV